MADRIGARQAAILRAIVREFIRTGEPVGSKLLVDRSRLDVSPATVRNEMARLEELGFLQQPHTSAGRVPTDAGYRFVVDQLKPRSLGEGQQRALAEQLEEPGTIDDLLRRASDVVSRFTHHAAAVLAQRARSTRVRRLELLRIADQTAMVVAIAENGRVEQRMVHTDADEEQLERLGDQLNRELHRMDIDEAATNLTKRAVKDERTDEAVLEGIGQALHALRDAESHVVVGGVANLANESDFEREVLHRLYEALEQQTAVLELLASAFDDQAVTVRIGSELGDADLANCSVVVARFGAPSDAYGSVGVIGPMRMDYDRVIATANAVARLLESALGRSENR